MNQKKLPIFKFIIVGASNVGKTSFIKQYSESIFIDKYETTLPGGYIKTKIVVVDKTEVKLQIWDTAGEERYRSLLNLHYRDAAAAFVLYDVNNRKTFSKLHENVKGIDECAPQEIIKILVGNKSDLERQVSQQEAEQFVNDNKFDSYFETSAKTGENVEKAFVEAVRSVIVRMYMNESFKSSILTIDNNIENSRFGSGTPINNPPQIQERKRLKSILQQQYAIPQQQYAIPQQQYAIPQQQQETNNKRCC
ncbi:unnamed protein product [Paramecium pentaurelia]|uniref:Uncharacterized protein n=1 Tax=Paramecium pentaurelia TaxID=43138 RepID=A0A8S1Y2T7_9CILI|nr:unnamed protein product [Paramecium pentaurelia]